MNADEARVCMKLALRLRPLVSTPALACWCRCTADERRLLNGLRLRSMALGRAWTLFESRKNPKPEK